MSTGKKIALSIIVLAAIVIVGLMVLVPMLIDVDRYRPQVAAHIQAETGKPAEIGRLALTLFPSVSIRVDDFALGNPPGFPQGHLLSARRISAVVDAGALLHREIIVKSLEIDEPAINLLSNVRGKWNFESSTKPPAVKQVSSKEKSLFTLGVISKVSVVKGQLTAANLLSSGKQGPAYFAARGVSSELEQVDLNAFIESASASIAPARSAFLAELRGAWGDSLAYAASPQSRPAAEGILKAESLRFGALQATAVKSKLRLFPKQVYFDDLNFDLYGGHGTGDLAFNFAGQNPRYSTSARLRNVDVAKLLEAFPGARGKMTGRMEGDMKLNGEVTHSSDPLAGMKGKGQLAIRNGYLPSLQLNKNLMQLARLTNLGSASGDPSSFSSMSTDLTIANQRITSNKITILGNGADVDGSGSMSLAGEGVMDYQGVASIAAGANAVTNVLAGLTGATFANGKLSLPFSLSGTLQNPIFKPKLGSGPARLGALQNLPGSAGQQAGAQPGQQPADVVQGIAGLFKKKKSQ